MLTFTSSIDSHSTTIAETITEDARSLRDAAHHGRRSDLVEIVAKTAVPVQDRGRGQKTDNTVSQRLSPEV